MFISLRKAENTGPMYSTDSSGSWYIDADGNVQAETIYAKQVFVKDALEIGTPEAPIGMTLYDTNTKQPYCLYITDGAVRTTSGKCATTGSSLPAPETISVTSTPLSGDTSPATIDTSSADTVPVDQLVTPVSDSDSDTATAPVADAPPTDTSTTSTTDTPAAPTDAPPPADTTSSPTTEPEPAPSPAADTPPAEVI